MYGLRTNSRKAITKGTIRKPFGPPMQVLRFQNTMVIFVRGCTPTIDHFPKVWPERPAAARGGHRVPHRKHATPPEYQIYFAVRFLLSGRITPAGDECT